MVRSPPRDPDLPTGRYLHRACIITDGACPWQAEGTQGAAAANGVEKSGFFPEENAVFVTSAWVAKEGEKLIENLFLGRVLGAGMQVRHLNTASDLPYAPHWWQVG